MNVLGVTHPMSWNNAACLLQGGELSAMAEEERLIRVKFAQGVAPLRAEPNWYVRPSSDGPSADARLVKE